MLRLGGLFPAAEGRVWAALKRAGVEPITLFE
jgi:hypothetical protein